MLKWVVAGTLIRKMIDIKIPLILLQNCFCL